MKMVLICNFDTNPIFNGTGLFSILYNRANNSKDIVNVLIEIKLKHKLNLTQSELSIEILALLWCMELAMLCSIDSFDANLKNCMMKDFLDTIYLHENSFDVLAILLLSQDKMQTNVYGILWEILSFASTSGLKYLNRNGEAVYPVDFPFKFWGGCNECNRPLRVAVVCSKPDMVHQLLNLGAQLPYINDACQARPQVIWNNDKHPILHLLNGCSFQVSESFLSGKDLNDPFAYKDAIVCLNILLIDIPYYSLTWKKIKMALERFSNGLSEDNVPCLKHICRFQIRHILKLNDTIRKPYVWKMLNLPVHLDSYIEIDLQMEIEVVEIKLRNGNQNDSPKP